MNQLYRLIDKFTEMIPPKILRVVRLAALLVWVLIAAMVVWMAAESGSESAPQMGQELSLANLRMKVEREENLRSVGEITIPDLNDVIRHESDPPSLGNEELELPRYGDPSPGLAGEDVRLLEPDPPVREADPLPYQGEGLDVFRGREYLPENRRETGLPPREAARENAREAEEERRREVPRPEQSQERESEAGASDQDLPYLP